MVADLAGQGTKEVSLVITQVFPSLIHFTLFSFFVFIAMFGMIPMWNDLFLFYQESGMNLLALEEFFFLFFHLFFPSGLGYLLGYCAFFI